MRFISTFYDENYPLVFFDVENCTSACCQLLVNTPISAKTFYMSVFVLITIQLLKEVILYAACIFFCYRTKRCCSIDICYWQPIAPNADDCIL